MRLTYADILLHSEDPPQRNPLPSTPFVGFVAGTALALLLWTTIGLALLSLLD